MPTSWKPSDPSWRSSVCGSSAWLCGLARRPSSPSRLAFTSWSHSSPSVNPRMMPLGCWPSAVSVSIFQYFFKTLIVFSPNTSIVAWSELVGKHCIPYRAAKWYNCRPQLLYRSRVGFIRRILRGGWKMPHCNHIIQSWMLFSVAFKLSLPWRCSNERNCLPTATYIQWRTKL